MKISLNWLNQYCDTTQSRFTLSEILEQLTMRGLEVEFVQDLSKGLEHVVCAQVLEKEPHPNANKLSLCKVSDGTNTHQIVCGAQNFKAGDKVALALIGAHLPNGLKIAQSKIRDVESFGMLCSESELGLAEQSEGIIILAADAKLGQPIADHLGRNEVVFELNITPNRGDALSVIGVAREVSLITGVPLQLPVQAQLAAGKSDYSVSLKDGCAQYHFQFFEQVKVGPSPAWLKQRLESVGQRSINNVVDITNFILLEWGTPIHSFDSACLDFGPHKMIEVRKAKEGEKIRLLDDTEIPLTIEDLVIADHSGPVALAGVMGGQSSQITEKSTGVFLEAAQFDPSLVRRTARRYQKHTDAAHRFERHIDRNAVPMALLRFGSLLQTVCGAKPAQGPVSTYSDSHASSWLPTIHTIDINLKDLNQFIGFSEHAALTVENVLALFEKAGFSAKATHHEKGSISVSTISHRPDVRIKEDFYEEIVRVLGYDKLPAIVPQLKSMPATQSKVDARFAAIRRAKNALASMGFNECVHFAFTSEKQAKEWAEPSTEASQLVSLKNPLNAEFSTLRSSLMSALYSAIGRGFSHQQRDMRFFEMRPVFVRDDSSETGVREEFRLAVIMTGAAGAHSLAAMDRDLNFYDAKGSLESFLEMMQVRGVRYQETSSKQGQIDSRVHPYQSASILLGKGPCGVLGRLHPLKEQDIKASQPVFFWEISMDRVLEMCKTDRKYVALPKFPRVNRDYSLLVPKDMAVDKIYSAMIKLGKPLMESVQVVDVYEGDKIPDGMRSVSFATVLSDPEKTLTDPEIDQLSQKILQGLEKELGIRLRTE